MDLEDMRDEWDTYCSDRFVPGEDWDRLWGGAKIICLKKEEPDTYLRAGMRSEEPWLLDMARRRAPKAKSGLSGKGMDELRAIYRAASDEDKGAVLAAAYRAMLREGCATPDEISLRESRVARYVRDNYPREERNGVSYEPFFTYARGIKALQELQGSEGHDGEGAS